MAVEEFKKGVLDPEPVIHQAHLIQLLFSHSGPQYTFRTHRLLPLPCTCNSDTRDQEVAYQDLELLV